MKPRKILLTYILSLVGLVAYYQFQELHVFVSYSAHKNEVFLNATSETTTHCSPWKPMDQKAWRVCESQIKPSGWGHIVEPRVATSTIYAADHLAFGTQQNTVLSSPDRVHGLLEFHLDGSPLQKLSNFEVSRISIAVSGPTLNEACTVDDGLSKIKFGIFDKSFTNITNSDIATNTKVFQMSTSWTGQEFQSSLIKSVEKRALKALVESQGGRFFVVLDPNLSQRCVAQFSNALLKLKFFEVQDTRFGRN